MKTPPINSNYAATMTSIITNTSAMAALRSLQSINSSLGDTQQRVSSGFRVGQASDNVAYWSISTTMNSDKKAMSAVSDSIGLAKAVLDTTYAGMDAIREELVSIRNLVVTAQGLPAPETNGYSNWTENQPDSVYDASQVAKVDGAINQHWQQINAIVEASSFAGVNLLKNDTSEPDLPGATTQFTTGFANGKIQTIGIDTKATTMINYGRTEDNQWNQPGSENMGYLDGILWSANIIFPLTFVDYDGTVAKNENPYTLRNSELAITADNLDRNEYYNALVGQITERIGAVTDGLAQVGATKAQVEIQDVFNLKMIDNVSSGVSRLVDADMEAESAKLSAQQTQQQLAIQTLSIANNTPRTILTLFQ